MEIHTVKQYFRRENWREKKGRKEGRRRRRGKGVEKGGREGTSATSGSL